MGRREITRPLTEGKKKEGPIFFPFATGEGKNGANKKEAQTKKPMWLPAAVAKKRERKEEVEKEGGRKRFNAGSRAGGERGGKRERGGRGQNGKLAILER